MYVLWTMVSGADHGAHHEETMAVLTRAELGIVEAFLGHVLRAPSRGADQLREEVLERGLVPCGVCRWYSCTTRGLCAAF